MKKFILSVLAAGLSVGVVAAGPNGKGSSGNNHPSHGSHVGSWGFPSNYKGSSFPSKSSYHQNFGKSFSHGFYYPGKFRESSHCLDRDELPRRPLPSTTGSNMSKDKAATQWHPLFAELLRPLLQNYYEVQTNVPVGDAPRETDILLVRRTLDQPPPFHGLWRHLTTWNTLEFKGPTVSARLRDLSLLVELGLGIERRLNEVPRL